MEQTYFDGISGAMTFVLIPNTFQRWVHVVGTYDGGNDSGVSAGNYGVSRKIFINGKETTVNENMYGTAGTNPLNLTTTTTPFRVGSQLSGTAYFTEKLQTYVYFQRNFLFTKSANSTLRRYFFRPVAFIVTLHKGNLGLGVAEPTSRFEIAGNGEFEYPPRAMTGQDTYMEGHGVFKATSSGKLDSGNTPTGFHRINFMHVRFLPFPIYGIQPHLVTIRTRGGNVYSGTDFAASTTALLLGRREWIHGAWTTLEMPYDILLQRIHLYQGVSPEEPPIQMYHRHGVILLARRNGIT